LKTVAIVVPKVICNVLIPPLLMTGPAYKKQGNLALKHPGRLYLPSKNSARGVGVRAMAVNLVAVMNLVMGVARVVRVLPWKYVTGTMLGNAAVNRKNIRTTQG
jgi:hypothetical protein